jgi:hypothetical protein
MPFALRHECRSGPVTNALGRCGNHSACSDDSKCLTIPVHLSCRHALNTRIVWRDSPGMSDSYLTVTAAGRTQEDCPRKRAMRGGSNRA